MPTGNMSSEPGGCTASNHRPEAIQCRCSVKLMLFFQVFCCQRHSREVFQEGFCTVILQAMRATKWRPCAATLQALCHHCCRPCAAFLHASCQKKLHTPSCKSACPVLQSLCRLTVGPLPPRCRYCAALLLSLSATLQAPCGSTADPVLLQSLLVAV